MLDRFAAVRLTAVGVSAALLMGVVAVGPAFAEPVTPSVGVAQGVEIPAPCVVPEDPTELDSDPEASSSPSPEASSSGSASAQPVPGIPTPTPTPSSTPTPTPTPTPSSSSTPDAPDAIDPTAAPSTEEETAASDGAVLAGRASIVGGTSDAAAGGVVESVAASESEPAVSDGLSADPGADPSPAVMEESAPAYPGPSASASPSPSPSVSASASAGQSPIGDVTDAPAVDESAVDESAVDEPAVDESAVDESAVDESVVDGVVGCPAVAVDVVAVAGVNEVVVSWGLGDEGVAPDRVLIVVSGPQADDSGVAVVDADPVSGEVPGSARVVGLRNGVEYGFVVIPVTELGAAKASAPVTATPTTGVDGEVAGVIVSFADGQVPVVGSSDVPGEERVGQVGLQVAGEVSDEAVLVEFSEAVDVATATQVASDLAAAPEVQWAEPDLFVTSAAVAGSGDAAAVDRWNLSGEYGIGLASVSTSTSSTSPSTSASTSVSGADADAVAGAGVTVAVIDTGINEHPDLDGHLVEGYDFVSSPVELAADRAGDGSSVAFDGDYVDPARFGGLGRDANPTDPGDWRSTAPTRSSTWHGVKVAGVIATVAPGAKVQPVRALSWRGGLLSDIAASITWASGGSIDGVPVNATPSSVINLSFSVQTPCPRSLQDAIDAARGRGSVLVAAAGNAGADAGAYAPGNCTGVITTGATGADGKRAAYSNHGAVVDMSAPGSAIATTSNTGSQGPDAATTATADGTSIAAAHVSAAAARYRSTSTGSTPDQVTEQLTGKSVRAFPGDTCDDTLTTSCGTGILTLAQVATTVTVTYANPYTGVSIQEEVDPTSFVPKTAAELNDSVGFPASWSYDANNGPYYPSTWTDGGVDQVNMPHPPIGNFYDPGVATTLTGDITLWAIYGPQVTVTLNCPRTLERIASYTVPRWSLTPAFPDPTNLATDASAGCVSWGTRFIHIDPSWSAGWNVPGRNVTSGSRYRVSHWVNVDFEADYVRLLHTLYFDFNGGTGSVFGGWPYDVETLTGDPRGDARLPIPPVGIGGNQWHWSLSKPGHYNRGDGLPYWTIKDVAPRESDPLNYCGNYWNDFKPYCNKTFFRPEDLTEAEWGPLTNPEQRDFTLVANYVPSWYLHYDLNGETTAADGTALVAPADSGDLFPAYPLPPHDPYGKTLIYWQAPPNPSGKSFLGWNTAADGSGTMHQPNSYISFNTAGQKTLYAQWGTNAYGLRFVDPYQPDQSSVPRTMAIEYGSTVSITTQVPTRRGYTFREWTTSSDGSGTSYSPGDDFVSVANETILYAQWTPRTYTVSFDLNDAEGSTRALGAPSSVSGATDTSVTISSTEPTRVGYTFGGWNTQADGAGTTYAAGASFPVGADDHDLYAKWQAKTYTFNAYANAGTPGEVWRSDTVTFDTAVAPFSGFAAPNWYPARVSGFNATADGTGTDYVSTDATFIINSDLIPASGTEIKAYVQWEYPFRFYSSSGRFPDSGLTYQDLYAPLNNGSTANQPIIPTPTTPTWTGYSFAGWTPDSSKSDTNWTASDTYYQSGDAFTFPAGSDALSPPPQGGSRAQQYQYLYAMYTPKSYLVLFDTQGGSLVDSLSFPTGGSVTIPAAPTKAGYEFRGWTTDSACLSGSANWSTYPCAGANKAVGSSYAPGTTASVTVYAAWKQPQTLTYSGPTSIQLQTAYGNQTYIQDYRDINAPTFLATSSSGLSVALAVDAGSQSVCGIDSSGGLYPSTWISWGAKGDCTVTMTQAGNDGFMAAAGSFTITALGVSQSFAPQVATGPNNAGGYVVRAWTLDASSAFTRLPITFATTTPLACSITTLTELQTEYDSNGNVTASGGMAVVEPLAGGTCTVVASQDGTAQSLDFSGGGPPVASRVPSVYAAAADLSFDLTLKARQSVTFPNEGSTFTLSQGSFQAQVDWQSSALPGEAENSAQVMAIEVSNGSAVRGDCYGTRLDGSCIGYNPVQSTVCSVDSYVGATGTTHTFNVTMLGLGTCALDYYIPGDANYVTAQRSTYAALGLYTISDALTVTYNAGSATSGSAPIDATRYAVGDSATILGNTGSLARGGYTFAGWNTAADGSGTDYAAGAAPSITSSLSLYPKWTANSYTVTFNSHGGSSVSADSYSTGGSVPEPSAPTRAGYSFAGWSLTDGGSAITWSSGSYAPGGYGDVTMHALWTANTYTVTFDSNGGSSVADGSYSTGGTVAEPTAPTRTGYTFAGWSLTDGGSAVTWTSSAYAPVGYGNLTMYALWTASTYTITLVANGGTVTPTSVSAIFGSSVTIPAPSRGGYTFTSWSGSDSASYSSGAQSWSTAQDVTLTAQWSPISYTVTFDSNGGSSVADGSYSTGGTVAEPTAPTRTGYTFAGWSLTDGGSAITWSSGSYAPGGYGDVTMHALWTAESYTVSFDANSGSGSASAITATYGSSVSLPGAGDFTRTGYVLSGWSTSSSGSAEFGTGTQTWLTDSGADGASDVLYAVWTAESYTVSFDANGGSGSAADVSPTYDASVTLPGSAEFSRSGHTFSGWATSPSGSVVYSSGSVTWATDAGANGATDTLYAVWTPESYTVALDANGGSSGGGAATSISPTYGQSVTLPGSSDYTRTHYTLAGWSTASSGAAEYATGSVTWATDAGADGGSDTLYAVWTPDAYAVTFEENGGSTVADTTFDADGTVAEPTAPTKAGATFVGWSATSVGTTPLTFPYAPGVYVPVTLYAIWGQGQSITFADPGPQRLVNGNFTISATTSSALDVTFSVSPSAQSVCTLVTQASPEITASTGAFASGATVTVKPLKKGTCTITATRAAVTSGGVVYAAASDIPHPFSILGIPQTIAFTDPSDDSFDYGATFTVTPAANGADSTTRDAVLTSGTTTICSVAGPTGGAYTVTMLRAGTCSLTASHAGDSNTYSAATSVTRSVEFVPDLQRDSAGDPVETPSGGATYIVNGVVSATPLTATADGSKVIAGVGPMAYAEQQTGDADFAYAVTPGNSDPNDGYIDMGLQGRTPDAATIDPATAVLRFVAGKDGVVTGEGFQANSLVEIWIMSTPTFLGYASVRGDGTFEEAFTVPPDLIEGDHTIQAEGLTYLNTRRAVNAGVEVVSAPSSSPGTADGGSSSAGSVPVEQVPVLAPVSSGIGGDDRPVIPPANVEEVAAGAAVYVEEDGTLRRTPQILRDVTTGEPWLTAGEPGDLVIALRGNEQGATTFDQPNSRLVFHLEKKGQAEGSGFMPGTEAEVWMFSTPTYLGTTTVRADGTWVIDFLVPPGLEIGEHAIQAEGVAPDGRERSVRAFVLVDREVVAKAKPRKVTKTMVMTFDPMSSVIDPDQARKFKRMIKGRGLVKVRTTGYVQPSGVTSNDLKLSWERAMAAAAFIDRRRLVLQTDINFSGVARGRRSAGTDACAKVQNRCTVITLTYRR